MPLFSAVTRGTSGKQDMASSLGFQPLHRTLFLSMASEHAGLECLDSTL